MVDIRFYAPTAVQTLNTCSHNALIQVSAFLRRFSQSMMSGMPANRITRRRLIQTALAAAPAAAFSRSLLAQPPSGIHIAPGPFKPTWESLRGGYKTPEWFRDAKFGIWNHWTAQCVPEQGDWYARRMYLQGDKDYDHHLKTYGHPSKVG